MQVDCFVKNRDILLEVSDDQIAVVMPAFNEESVIADVIKELPESISIRTRVYQIVLIVVDDGSSDDTVSAVEQSNAKLVRHILNFGAGAATRTGLDYAREAGFRYVVTMDADGQHHKDDITKLMREISKDKADLIIGSRLINAEGMPWHRVAGNKFLSFLTFLMFGVFVTDSQSGLKAFNARSLEKIKFFSNNFAFCSEIIWKAHQQKLRIEEVPIRALYSEYSLSKGQSNWDALHILRELLKRRLLEILHG